jgi:ribosomal protein S6--L-glutamate ligase
MTRLPKIKIGWEEWCGLPALGLPAVLAKVDTGAKTSALHAFDIQIYVLHHLNYVRFKINPLPRRKEVVRVCEALLTDRRVVISSNGEREIRPVISTPLKFGDRTVLSEITLTSRHKMSFRMLLGREALRKGRLYVDPAKSCLLGRVVNAHRLY